MPGYLYHEWSLSGECSNCGTAVLIALDSREKPTPKQLLDALEDAFIVHVQERHAPENSPSYFHKHTS